jgi:hypothetical protein
MKIETKYDIGQEVWCMFCDELTQCTIEAIKPYINRRKSVFTYYVVPNDGSTYGFNIEEYELFPTKEELLKSL